MTIVGQITEDQIRETKKKADFGLGECFYYDLQTLEEKGLVDLKKLPFSIRVLLENALRNFDGKLVTREGVETIMNWPAKVNEEDVPYMPARVVLQDFTGVPLIVDLADMRDAMAENGGDPAKINPKIPTDLVIDHSAQVDYYARPDAMELNTKKEYERNIERYKLIKWAQQSFENMRVVPPGSGIVHQVNLEYLSPLVTIREVNGEKVAVIDSAVGTDSHTPMVNGLGVFAFGVGGIEAEASMLGLPYYLLLPEVIGVRLTGKLPEGTTATDLVLTVTELLRKKGVVGKFVEYFGPGLDNLTLPDRATLSNMAPEYGATIGYFPVDEETLKYLLLTGRDEKHVNFIRNYLSKQGLIRNSNDPEPQYSDVVELDLSTVESSLAGPRNPEERLNISELGNLMEKELQNHPTKGEGKATFTLDGQEVTLKDGDIVIASVTSCTNTSNPAVLIGAALLARNAVEKELSVKPYVKTSWGPGSRVVTKYIEKLKLTKYLDSLGFQTVGYACFTCIGNSGPLKPEIEKAIKENNLYVTSVLSGNRNFTGRVHQLTSGNFLASPMLVIAYALAGTTKINILKDPIGYDQNNNPVYLKDIWPSQEEIHKSMQEGLDSEMFKKTYNHILEGDSVWKSLDSKKSLQYPWDPKSTYIRRPPYFKNFKKGKRDLKDIKGARVLVMADMKVSTDHISPAGAIAKDSPAAKYLIEHGVSPADFNTYGSRRGNHEVMMRGTFANVKFINLLGGGKKGWWTTNFLTNKIDTTFDTAMEYIKNNIPSIVLGVDSYGRGSSRDWAAKGPSLLGIKAVLAKDFERIHRSNLIGVAILPLEFKKGEGWKELGLDGTETYDILGLEDLEPGKMLKVVAHKNGNKKEFEVKLRIDTPIELDYFLYGGIMPYLVSKELEN